jgi:hypothetical protein
MTPKSSDFWQNVQFEVELVYWSNYTDISLAPSAIYNFNEYSFGSWSQYTYLKKKITMLPNLWWQYYRVIQSHTCNPTFCWIRGTCININLDGTSSNSQDYWNTGLFRAGYRSGNATIGARYNVLNDTNNIYGSPFMPFVRVYFKKTIELETKSSGAWNHLTS